MGYVRSLLGVALLAAVGAAGCSDECETNQDCRDELGPQYTCNAGTCETFGEVNNTDPVDAGPRPDTGLPDVPDTGPMDVPDTGPMDVPDSGSMDVPDAGDAGMVPDTGVPPDPALSGLLWLREVDVVDEAQLQQTIRFEDFSGATRPTVTMVSTSTECTLVNRTTSSPTLLDADQVRVTPQGGDTIVFTGNAGVFTPPFASGGDLLEGAPSLDVEVTSTMVDDVRTRGPATIGVPDPFVPQLPASNAIIDPQFTTFMWQTPAPSGSVVFAISNSTRTVELTCVVDGALGAYRFSSAALMALRVAAPAGPYTVEARAQVSRVLPLDIDTRTFDAELRLSRGTTYTWL